jgi:GT2 family glycosyltransferase
MRDPQLTWSIIVPTHGRPAKLAAYLEALAWQEYPVDRFEVIVVDDGSMPPLVPMTIAREGLRVRWLRQDNAGPAAARNHGATMATGAWLAFTDDDCAPMPRWLHELANAAESHPEALLGGATRNALIDNCWAMASQLIVDTALAWVETARRDLQFVPSNNLAMPAAAFHAIGGFDVSFRTSEDRELCDRWIRHGGTIVRAPHAIVEHAHDLTLRGFWRQHFGYGRGARRFHRARQSRGSPPFRPEGWHALLACRTAWRRMAGVRRIQVIAALALWQVANLAGFVWEGLSGGRPVPEP